MPEHRLRAEDGKLWLYRVILAQVLPLMVAQVLWAQWRGRMPPGALAERLGRGAPAAGPSVWLHGASNGELTSARWLIAALRAARPDLGVVVTSNSATARAMVRAWGMEGVSARLAPFDTPGALRRFCRVSQVNTLIFLENELWPERIACMRARGPVICLGARMSAGSARNWGRFAPRLIARMLAGLSLVSAQDAGSEARLLGLGLPPDRLGPRLMLKSRAAAAVAADAPFVPPVARARILLAASTHEGEEAVALRGFMAARNQFDLLILAPRHPRRSAAVAALLREAGLRHALRSGGETPGAGTEVYLADTLGEMAHWYAMAGATVIGGTFGDAGGHTPYEPAAAGSALVHGPGVANFTEAFAALDTAGAALCVSDTGLGAALAGLDGQTQARLAAAANSVLNHTGTQDDALLARVLALLPPPEVTPPALSPAPAEP